MRKQNSGSTILVVVLLLSLLALVPIGSQMIRSSVKSTDQNLKIFAQSDNIARAGLIDAISWFKRQPDQPVRSSADPLAYEYPDAAFYPRHTQDPTTSDTIDESMGLVKEYQLGDNATLWARYEILRQQDPNSNDFNPHAVHDMTEHRVDGFPAGSGLAWQIESIGYVFKRKDPNRPFNQSPNEIISKSRAAVEIRRLALELPAQAAVFVNEGSNVALSDNAKIFGIQDIGLAYYSAGTGPTINGSDASITGSFDQQAIGGGGPLRPEGVFGVTQNELKLLSDITVSDTAHLPETYPAMAVVFIDGQARFDATIPLRGGGILFVNGDLFIGDAPNHLFGGLIYATGSITIYGETLISGSVLSEDNLVIIGAGAVAQIEYDNNILNSVRQQVAQYREYKTQYFSFNWDR